MLDFENWPAEVRTDHQPPQEWRCPRCQAANSTTVKGRFVRALPWVEPESPNRW